MNTKQIFFNFLLILSGTIGLTAMAHSQSMDEAILQLQKEWAVANYQTAEDDLEKTFEALVKKAEEMVKKYPDTAEPLIWNAIIVSSDAGKNGGLSALGKVKTARKLLLEAEKINSDALDGSIYTSLGSLYYQVPGWPIGFGDDKQAEKYLKKALDINPDGIDPNYFYADFMLEEGNKEEARKYFNKALAAPARPNRPVADKGRRDEIHAKLKTLTQ
jgi:tetratricopeptide (TPR) repeat protein